MALPVTVHSFHAENQLERLMGQRELPGSDCAYLMNQSRLGKTPYLEKIDGGRLGQSVAAGRFQAEHPGDIAIARFQIGKRGDDLERQATDGIVIQNDAGARFANLGTDRRVEIDQPDFPLPHANSSSSRAVNAVSSVSARYSSAISVTISFSRSRRCSARKRSIAILYSSERDTLNSAEQLSASLASS